MVRPWIPLDSVPPAIQTNGWEYKWGWIDRTREYKISPRNGRNTPPCIYCEYITSYIIYHIYLYSIWITYSLLFITNGSGVMMSWFLWSEDRFDVGIYMSMVNVVKLSSIRSSTQTLTVLCDQRKDLQWGVQFHRWTDTVSYRKTSNEITTDFNVGNIDILTHKINVNWEKWFF